MNLVANYSKRTIVLDEGQIVFDDKTSKLFNNYQQLKSLNLDLPYISKLALELKDKGIINFDELPITLDELYILLTWNGIGGKFREFDLNDSFMSPAKKIIDTYHKEYPNGKVTLIGIPKPSTHAGLGAYYEIGISNGDNYEQSVTVMNYNQTLENWCKMKEYSSFMRYVDGMGQFDSEYNMPSTGKPVNNQNTTTEPVGTSMGLHPTTNGYRQIGDAFFRALMKEW
jgi:hypothetical protein